MCSGSDARMMTGAVNADYQALSELTNKFVELFESTKEVRVTCDNGTDVTYSVEGRNTMAVDGNCNKPGQWNFAPAGTTATAPLEGTTNGTIVFAGSLAPFGIVDEPLNVEVKDGQVEKIQV
ncbi:hypothetical protein ACJROX_28090 [Pseudalkalibacillus sp. A8]|uniref:hypothetical protein n=1 Tax=Pseudalkalibacillus sp. A8 TaxID=3382641 RepID=UPI0038B5F570